MKIEEAVRKYVEFINKDGGFSAEDAKKTSDVMTIGLKMMTALPFEVEQGTLTKAIVLLALYAISNGRNKQDAEIVCRAFCDNLQFFLKEGFNPIADGLNIFYGEEPDNQ